MAITKYILDKILPKGMSFIIITTQISFTVIIFGSIIARSFFGRDLYGNEDFVLIAAFWLYLIGGAYGTYNNSHIKADILTELLKPGRNKTIILLTSSIVETIINFVVTIWGWQLIVWSIGKGAKSISWKIPMSIPQSAIFVGFLIMFIYSSRQIYQYILQLKQNSKTT
jgi:TRAP-type C4-dicarboxylate transport system permease small subunit